jgi:signal transduction histidine kinase
VHGGPGGTGPGRASPWRAVRGNPLRFFRAPLWRRSFAYLAVSVPVGALWLASVAALIWVWLRLTARGLGEWLFQAWAGSSEPLTLLAWAVAATVLFWGVIVPNALPRPGGRGKGLRALVVAVTVEAVLPVIMFRDNMDLLTVGVRLLLGLHVVVAVFALVPLSATQVIGAERAHLRRMGLSPPPSRHRPVPRGDRLRALRWVGVRLQERETWRDLWQMLRIGLADAVPTLVVFGGGLTILLWQSADISGPSDLADLFDLWPVPVVAALAVPYGITAWAAVRQAFVYALLGGHREGLGRRLFEVTASRARILDAFEAERRRIERDLHDGAQQRLTGLIMTLGLVRLDLDGASPRAREMVERAQDEARAALGELRDLVRGIYPQVLADRGLGAAVEGLAQRCAVPVEVDIDLPERLPEAIESAAYFVAAEALANVAKHSGAGRAAVSARLTDGDLVVEIEDDGSGNADPVDGGGLVGLADRVAVYRGSLKLSSPPGGPTVLRVEIPVTRAPRP